MTGADGDGTERERTGDERGDVTPALRITIGVDGAIEQ